MKHFVSSTGCNATNKVNLTLDSHSSHKNLAKTSTWLKSHPGRTVGLHQVAAYGSAATVGNIASGFAKNEIYSLNPHVFPDHLFLPSEVTANVIEMETDDEELLGSATGFIQLFQDKFAPPDPMQPNAEDAAGSPSNTAQLMMNPTPVGPVQRVCQVIS